MNKQQMAYEAGWKAALASVKSNETKQFRPLEDGTAIALEVKDPDLYNAIEGSTGAIKYNNGCIFMDAYYPQMLRSLIGDTILNQGEFEEACNGDKPYIVCFVKK